MSCPGSPAAEPVTAAQAPGSGLPEPGPGAGARAELGSVPAQPGPACERPGDAGRLHPVGAARILVVDDQPELVRALAINLRARQYEVLAAQSDREALALAVSHLPDAVILDLGLPDIDGIEVIAALREWCHAPIIVLSGRTSLGDKIGALDVGADDYVTKPFAMAELLARLRAALRRDDGATTAGSRPVAIGRWLVDLAAHQVRRADSTSET